MTGIEDSADRGFIRPAEMSPEERQAFIDEVESEMRRLGFDRKNEAAAKSVILTERDYGVYINT